MIGADTVGIAVDDSRIYLDQYVAQLSARANTFVIAVFDCCRTNEETHKGAPIEILTLKGQHLILYASGKG